jgi:hypothetical protein
LDSKTDYNSLFKYTVERRERPYDITDDEMAVVKKHQLNEKSTAKLSERDNQIHQAEAYLEGLMNELRDRKPFHEKL